MAGYAQYGKYKKPFYVYKKMKSEVGTFVLTHYFFSLLLIRVRKIIHIKIWGLTVTASEKDFCSKDSSDIHLPLCSEWMSCKHTTDIDQD